MLPLLQIFPVNLIAKVGQPLVDDNAVMTLSLKARKLLQPGPVRVDEEVHMHVGQTHTDIIYIWIPYMGKDIKFDLCKSWEASWSWTFLVWIRWFCRSAYCCGTNCETGCILLLIWSQCFSLAKPVTHRLGGSVHSPQILFQHQLPKYEQDHNECGKDLPHLEFCGGGKVWLVFFSMVRTVVAQHAPRLLRSHCARGATRPGFTGSQPTSPKPMER